MAAADGAPRQLEVAVVTPPALGHAIPLSRIAAKLVEAGHRVSFYSFAISEKKLAGEMPKGAHFVGLPTTVPFSDHQSLVEHFDAKQKFPFVEMSAMMLEPLRRQWTDRRPDVVLTDFFIVSAPEVAGELNIPCVVSAPAPLSALASTYGAFADPNMSTSCCGVHLGLVDLNMLGFVAFQNIMGIGDHSKLAVRHNSRSLFLVQTHWGLEPPRALPPNWKVVGPVADPPTQALRSLQEKAPDLCRWLEAPGAKPVIYVSTGTEVQLFDWQVRVLFEGFKAAGVRVVWSLKEKQQEFLPAPKKDHPDFWISSWLPQAELLSHGSVKAFVTHCGWGAMLELTSAGKPAAGLPFFGDQPLNLDVLVQSGIGEALGQKLKPGPGKNRYTEGMITAESVSTAIRKVVFDPKYAENARRASNAAKVTGGAKEAAFHVEMAGRWGCEHQCSQKLWRRTTGTSSFSLLATGALASLAAVCGGICALL